MLGSGDGKTRSVVRNLTGSGWDFNMSRHRFHALEADMGPSYTVYNRRFMTLNYEHQDVVDGYWKLRQEAAVLHTGELPLAFEGPDAERLLDLLFTKDITKVKTMRCGYGLACYHDGGLIVDGVLMRLAADRFWYVQADGDFYSWARAHAVGMDVKISDPKVYVSQVQGPRSLDILASASASGKLPEPFGYFAVAKVDFGGQQVFITRTGYTNELGWEFYVEPHHDVEALWAHLETAGKPFGMTLFGLDSMHIRRIEAGILNAGTDFNETTTPFDVGLGRFVDMDKDHFIGKEALATAPKEPRSTGLKCPTAEPLIQGEVIIDGALAGRVTAGAFSPFLKHGTGIVLLDKPGYVAGTPLQVRCVDGALHDGELHDLPFYDAEALIPRGKAEQIPQRA